MLKERDYCDYDTKLGLRDIGYPMSTCQINDGPIQMPKITLYEAQKWMREEKGIHIAPRIYLYHDINLDENTSWECTIYIEWSAIYTIGKSLTYEDALLLGIKEAVKVLNKKQEYRNKLELENTEFNCGHNVSSEQKDYEET